MNKAELKSAIEESIVTVKSEIAELKEQAKDRMHDRDAISSITQELRILVSRLNRLEQNLRQGS